MGCRRRHDLHRLEWSACRWGWLSIFFTSSRTRKFFCLFHNCMWQSRHPEVSVYFLELSERTGWLFINRSPCSYMICVCVFVCVFVLIWTFNRRWHTTGKQVTLFFHWCFSSHVRNIFDFLNTRTGLLLWQNRSPCSKNWIFGWVCWESFPPRATSEPNSFIQSSLEDIFGGGRGDAHTFSFFDFSRFHHDSLRDTISWECVVKDDCVRSCLIELQSFLQSKVDVDPIHRILMLLPFFMHVLRMTRCIQIDRIKILVVFVHGIHRQREYCLSGAQILSSRYQSWIDDGM